MHGSKDDEEDCAAESELDDSESEADVVPEDEKQAAHKEGKKEIKPTAVPTTVISPAENKGQQKTKTKSSEEVLICDDIKRSPVLKVRLFSTILSSNS